MSVASSARNAPPEQMRLMVVASRLYHVHGLRQRDIALRLEISQARVSRLLQQAEQHGIIRTVVDVPDGLHPHLEESLEQRYGLRQVHIVDVDPELDDPATVLGRAAAHYLGEIAALGEVVGFTSWSRTLQEMAHAMPTVVRTGTRYVVEMLGDLGSPLLQHSAARATKAMARALGAEAVFLRTPGVASSAALRDDALRDPHVRRALGLLGRLDVAFIGVGPPDVHGRLGTDDRYFTADQLAQARAAGAVGQLNQRFLDAAGRPVNTPLDDLVVGSSLDEVTRARRRVVVAGGADKHRPLAAALAGGFVDVLLTDAVTARALAAAPDPPGP